MADLILDCSSISFSRNSAVRFKRFRHKAAGFSGRRHAHVDRFEDVRVRGERIGKFLAGKHIVEDCAQDPAHPGIASYCGQTLEGVDKGHSGIDADRDLAGEDHQLFQSDFSLGRDVRIDGLGCARSSDWIQQAAFGARRRPSALVSARAFRRRRGAAKASAHRRRLLASSERQETRKRPFSFSFLARSAFVRRPATDRRGRIRRRRSTAM